MPEIDAGTCAEGRESANDNGGERQRVPGLGTESREQDDSSGAVPPSEDDDPDPGPAPLLW